MEMESNLMNAYTAACRIACEALKERDPHEISLNTNAVYDSFTNMLYISYLNREYAVDCASGEIRPKNDDMPVTTTVKVLILHYLLHSRIRPLSGNLISFREIPGGGSIYFQTFRKRAVEPLVNTFSGDIEGFFRAVGNLSGTKENFGHASASIKVFPLIPVTFVLWQGDEEIPAAGAILFDDTVGSFLPGEDIVLAASFGVYELMKSAGKGK